MNQPPKKDHNNQLPDYIRRIESLNVTVKDTNSDIRDLYTELKSKGYNTKVVRALIKKRAADQKQLAEFNELLDLYEHATQLVLPLDNA